MVNCDFLSASEPSLRNPAVQKADENGKEEYRIILQKPGTSEGKEVETVEFSSFSKQLLYFFVLKEYFAMVNSLIVDRKLINF